MNKYSHAYISMCHLLVVMHRNSHLGMYFADKRTFQASHVAVRLSPVDKFAHIMHPSVNTVSITVISSNSFPIHPTYLIKDIPFE